jgi:hypothetical protein
MSTLCYELIVSKQHFIPKHLNIYYSLGFVKCAALQKVMTRFGIMELARTGRICLKRGMDLLEPNAPLQTLASFDGMPGVIGDFEQASILDEDSG